MIIPSLLSYTYTCNGDPLPGVLLHPSVGHPVDGPRVLIVIPGDDTVQVRPIPTPHQRGGCQGELGHLHPLAQVSGHVQAYQRIDYGAGPNLKRAKAEGST
jgi:hypothetical protein